MPLELIIGANGYLGQYLAAALAHEKREALLHSRTPISPICRQTGLPFIQEDLVESRKYLSAINPHTIYLLARPVTQSAGVFIDFAQNIQWLLQEWADRGNLRRVVFASTQLVYATPPDATPIPTSSPLAPETAYDCHKAEMEFFLALLAHHQTPLTVEIYRLPLLAGMPPTPTQSQEQFLFQWRADYLAGQRWDFPPHNGPHRTWGNSWAHVLDVVKMMLTPRQSDPPKRFHLVQPASGHLSYLALDTFFKARYPLPPAAGTLYLPKTHFYLQDNANTPQRTIEEAFPQTLEVAP